MKRVPTVLSLVLLVAGFLHPAPVRAQEVRSISVTVPEEGPAERVYFYSASRDEKKLLSLHKTLVDRGARNVNCFLPRVVVCELPTGLSAHSFANNPDISIIFESQVDEETAQNGLFDPGWVRHCYAEVEGEPHESSRATSSLFDPLAPWDESVLMVPEETVRRTEPSRRADYPDPRNIQQNSELMTGTILANLIFPESVPHPYRLEEWTDDAIADATGQATLGLLYYQYEYRKAGLNFIVRPIERVPILVEPIDEAFKETSWIREVMQGLGYADDGSPDRHLTAVHEFNNDKRTEFNTLWAFTAFIVDAEKDQDHKFPSSRNIGWSFLGGPYFVTPYPAGSSTTAQAFKHYMGSVFWALQEAPNMPDNCTSYSGYLNYQNRNKTVRDDPVGGPIPCPGIYGFPESCIMNHNDAFDWGYGGPPCEYTAGMIGLSDKNHNSVPDCLDAAPKVYFENSDVETVFTQDITLRFKAVSEGVPNQNPRQSPDLRVTYAVPVKFVGRSDRGVITQKLLPVDGVYDELEEEFEFELETLAAGSSRFSVVTKNAANAMSEEQSKEIFHIGLAYLHFGYQNYNEGNLIKFDLLGETFDAKLDVHRIDLEGDHADKVIAADLEPSHSAGSFTLFEYLDNDVVPGVKYCYYVNGTFTTTYRDQDTTVTARTYDIETRAMIPVLGGSVISRASPNPFNERTMVSIVVRATYDDPSAEFSAAVQADVNVTVFDVLGRHVKRLYSDRVGAQVLTLQWDGTNENFERVPAGVYFIKALAADVEGVTKVVIVR